MTGVLSGDKNLDIETLKALIEEEESSREKECQPYLEGIREHLCRQTPTKILRSKREEPSRMGYNDFCLSALISDGALTKKTAYVWEVKAPQTFVMEFDDNADRLRPTKELIKAETQLLHYVEEFSSSPSFRNYFQLEAISEVIPAGIIIGCRRTLVRPGRYSHDTEGLISLFRYSMHLRTKSFYEKAGIQIKTWEWVYECLTTKPRTAYSASLGAIGQ